MNAKRDIQRIKSDMRRRDYVKYELALEHVLGLPFSVLIAEAKRTQACEMIDLHQMGRQLYFDLVRMARGEISKISIPARLPHHGEFAP